MKKWNLYVAAGKKDWLLSGLEMMKVITDKYLIFRVISLHVSYSFRFALFFIKYEI